MRRGWPALVALLCLAGCGGGGEDKQAATPTATSSASATATATATPEDEASGGSRLTHRQLVKRLDAHCERYVPKVRDANRHVIRSVSSEREATVPVKRAARLSAGFEAGIAKLDPPKRDASAFQRHLTGVEAQREAIADFETAVKGKQPGAVATEVASLRRATRKASARRVKAAKQLGAAKCAKRT